MDPATALWILLPLALVHVLVRRRRAMLCFQLAVDVALLLLPGRALLRGRHVGPGAPGALEWGGAVTVAGSAEQSDLPLEFAPWWEEVRRLAGTGAPPWISDRIGGGVPLFANGQTGVPFPLAVPVWFLGAERGTDVMAVWKLELAAIGGFLLLRRFGVREVAAAAGSLGYAFGLYPLSWLVVPLAWVVALAPWALWALLAALRGDRRAAAGLAVLLGVPAGWSVHPESAAFLWIAVAVTGTVLAWGRVRRLRRLVAPFLLAALVAAVGALPAVATVGGSAKLAASRAASTAPDPGLGWPLKLRMMALLVAPWREGNPGTGTWRRPFPNAAVAASAGAVPLVFLFAAPLRRRHRRAALALAAVGVGAAGLVYQLPGLAHVAARVPVLGLMTWVRSGFLIGLALACLGAFGLDAWLRRRSRWRLVTAAAIVQASVLALVVSGPVRPGWSGWAVAAAPAGAALAAACSPVAVPVVVGIEAVGNGWAVLGRSREGAGATPIVAELRRLVTAEGGRVVGLGDALPANLAARFGLADLRSADPVRSLGLARLHQALGAPGMDLPGPVTTPWAGLAGAWGVRWLATPTGGVGGAAAAGWQEVFRDAGGRLYRNPRCLPVLRLATRAVGPPGDAAAGAWDAVDFATTAVTPAPVSVGGGGTLEVVSERPWRHAGRVQASSSVLAVLHVPSAPGWRARLDGQPAKIVDADLGAMGVVVPPGGHEVTWTYAPPFLTAGIVLTLAGLVGCLGLALGWPRRTR